MIMGPHRRMVMVEICEDAVRASNGITEYVVLATGARWGIWKETLHFFLFLVCLPFSLSLSLFLSLSGDGTT